MPPACYLETSIIAAAIACGHRRVPMALRFDRTAHRLARACTLIRHYGIYEAVVVAVAFLIYFTVRGLVVDRAGEAMVRAFNLIELEQQLRIYWELQMQAWILDSYWAIRALNWVYFWGHMPLVALLAVWLFVFHRRAYYRTRNAFLASGAIGVVIYWLFPVAPPRLVPFSGFIDTMAAFDRFGYNAQETEAFVNPFAAVPSLHFGWALLLGTVVAWVGRHPLAIAFGIAWPVAMFFAVVMTGNHFILDAVFGGIVAFAGFGIALLIERFWHPAARALAARLPAREPVK